MANSRKLPVDSSLFACCLPLHRHRPVVGPEMNAFGSGAELHASCAVLLRVTRLLASTAAEWRMVIRFNQYARSVPGRQLHRQRTILSTSLQPGAVPLVTIER